MAGRRSQGRSGFFADTYASRSTPLPLLWACLLGCDIRPGEKPLPSVTRGTYRRDFLPFGSHGRSTACGRAAMGARRHRARERGGVFRSRRVSYYSEGLYQQVTAWVKNSAVGLMRTQIEGNESARLENFCNGWNRIDGQGHKQTSGNAASRQRRGPLSRVQNSAAARSVHEQKWLPRI